MRSIQKDKRAALATFHGTFDLRRAIFTAAQREVREARENLTNHLATPEAVHADAPEAFDPDTTNNQPEVHDE